MKRTIFKTVRLIAIVAAIIVAIVFIVNTGLKMLKQKKFDDVQTDLLSIQAKVKTIKGKSEVNSNTDAYVGIKASEHEDEEIRTFLKDMQIEEADFEKYYVLSGQDFDKMGITEDLKNKEDNLYIVNYDTAEVIYKKGVEVDGNTKYKLSDIVVKKEKKEWVLHNRGMED